MTDTINLRGDSDTNTYSPIAVVTGPQDHDLEEVHLQAQLAGAHARIVANHWRMERIPWLPLVLLVQATLALRLIWSNTAFADESLYLWAGHLELQHWLHRTPLPNFATYFSGAPVIYPPLGAIAFSFGGLTAARLLSLIFMLGATCFLYATTRRLFGRAAAIASGATFAVLGPTQFLGAFATFDAMCVFLIAAATWCAVRARAGNPEPFLVSAGLLLALADATKYASVLWTPIVIMIVAFTAPSSGWLNPLLRALRTAAYTCVPLLIALYAFGGSSYVRGIMFTTLDRQAGGTYASVSTVLADSFSWIGIVFCLAVAGTIISFITAPRRVALLCLVLTVAVLLAPLHQAQIHTSVSLHKHVVFGALFGAIVVGYVCQEAATHVTRQRGWVIGTVIAGITLFIGLPQATSMFIYGWPNTSRMTRALSAVIPKVHCPCLVTAQSPLRLYLPHLAATNTVIGPYSFYHYDPANHAELHGTAAYELGITTHYFHVIEVDPAENPAIYGPIVSTLKRTQGYRLRESISIDHWGRRTMQIWSYTGITHG